jgi:hypothetical protein
MVSFDSPRERIIRAGVERLIAGRHYSLNSLVQELGINQTYSPGDATILDAEIALRFAGWERNQLKQTKIRDSQKSYRLEDYLPRDSGPRPCA